MPEFFWIALAVLLLGGYCLVNFFRYDPTRDRGLGFDPSREKPSQE